MSHGGNAGVEQEKHLTAGAPQPTRGFDVDFTDRLNASDSNQQQTDEAASLLSDSITYCDIERTEAPSFKSEARASSPSPSARPIRAERATEFNQPAAIEGQRVVWLPKDPLGLVQEIEQELASWHILCSTEGAEMDSQGKFKVTSAPEEVRRAPMEARRPPYKDEGDEKGLSSLWGLMRI